jgi:two-component system, NarL family, sensor kinase
MYQNPEIYFVTVIGIILGLLLVSFIVAVLVFHKRRQKQHEQEFILIKAAHEQEILRTQMEIQQDTLNAIAQEIHDNINQVLQTTIMTLDAMPLEESHPAYAIARESHRMATKAQRDLRNITHRLHTGYIIAEGLIQAIRHELTPLQVSGVIKHKVTASADDRALKDQETVFLFRIFQEALQNILKHANASYVIVDVENDTEGNFVMSIEDNGCGFAPATTGQDAQPKGLGLKNIYNRAKTLGAAINITSQMEEGTKIVVKLPLPPQKDDPHKQKDTSSHYR